MTLLMNFRCENTEINLLTKDETLRKTNIDRLKKCIDELPPYLIQRNPKVDTHNSEAITINRLGTSTRRTCRSGPRKVHTRWARLTSPMIQIDEAPFQPNVKHCGWLRRLAATVTLQSIRSSANGARLRGDLHDTAGKIDDSDGAFIYGAGQAAAIGRRSSSMPKTPADERLVRHGPR